MNKQHKEPSIIGEPLSRLEEHARAIFAKVMENQGFKRVFGVVEQYTVTNDAIKGLEQWEMATALDYLGYQGCELYVYGSGLCEEDGSTVVTVEVKSYEKRVAIIPALYLQVYE